MKAAFLFSGQGAQYIGMGKELYDNFPCAASVFQEADAALGFPISEICFEDSGGKLDSTEFTQPAILTASIAAFRVLEEKGITAQYMAGLSLGEYSACVAGGVMSFADGVSLVRKRGRFMTEAVPVGAGAMYAVLGLERESVQEVCTRVSAEKGYVAIANCNAPGQIVIAGETLGAEAAAEILKEQGAKMAVKLNVSGPFHTALLKPAAVQLKEALEKIQLNEPKCPIVTNVTAKPYESKDEIIPTLTQQVMEPVLWEDTLKYLYREGVDTFIEIGPGKALSGFVKRTLKGVRILNVEDLKSLEKTLAALEEK